jgi:hypothetical protein
MLTVVRPTLASAQIGALRQGFVDEGAPIQQDLQTLRGAVRCPEDAPPG